MTIAVTGHKGRLGSWLVQECGCTYLSCDVTKPDEIAREIEIVSPDVVINCAAWTEVDEAELPGVYDEVMAVNMRGPANVRRAMKQDSLLVQMSTGFVFDGEDGPYDEEALPGPVNMYGWSKFGGESAALIRQPTIVVRVLDLFGPSLNGKSDFVRQIRDALELGVEKELPDRLFGTPTYVPHLAEALMQIANKWSGSGPGIYVEADDGLHIPSAKPDVIHIAGSLTMSRADWGKMIAESFGYDPALIIPTSEIKCLAPRPLRGGLNVAKAKAMGIPIYSPADGLAALKTWEQARGEQYS